MNVATKWLAAGVVTMGVLVGAPDALAAESPSAEVEVDGTAPAAGEGAGLGVYEQLVGKSFVLPDGREAVWRRSASGNEVIREMFDSAGGLEWIAVIARLNDSGKLGYIENVRGIAGSTGTKWGQVQPDGSVRWTNENGYVTQDSLRGSDFVAEVFDPHGKLLATHLLSVAANAQAEPDSATRDAMAIKLLEDLPGFVSSSIASIQAAARTAEERRKMGESARRFNRAMESVNDVLSTASDGGMGGYAEAQANLDATVANIQHAAATERRAQTPAQQQAPARAVHYPTQVAERVTQTQPEPPMRESETTAAEPAAPSAGKPLRFVMSISLRNQPGDKVNPTCYSNIVSRPGPPGWGASGFLPPGSAEQARETVYSLKSAFIAQCRASGREITSDGNFNFQLNQSQGDEERLQEMRARYSEDVSVSL